MVTFNNVLLLDEVNGLYANNHYYIYKIGWLVMAHDVAAKSTSLYALTAALAPYQALKMAEECTAGKTTFEAAFDLNYPVRLHEEEGVVFQKSMDCSCNVQFAGGAVELSAECFSAIHRELQSRLVNMKGDSINGDEVNDRYDTAVNPWWMSMKNFFELVNSSAATDNINVLLCNSPSRKIGTNVAHGQFDVVINVATAGFLVDSLQPHWNIFYDVKNVAVARNPLLRKLNRARLKPFSGSN